MPQRIGNPGNGLDYEPSGEPRIGALARGCFAVEKEKRCAVPARDRRPCWLRVALATLVLALSCGGLAAGAWGQPADREATSNDPELLVWQSIMNSKSTSDFRAYLSTYPSGTFVTVATARLSVLGGEQPAAGDQSSPRSGGADALRQGFEAFKGGDYAEAMKAWRTAAQAGSPPAMVLIGGLYYSGRGAPKDYGEALQWFRQAADKRNAKGESMMGELYYYGRGVEQDFAQAAQWYRKAAVDVRAGTSPAADAAVTPPTEGAAASDAATGRVSTVKPGPAPAASADARPHPAEPAPSVQPAHEATQPEVAAAVGAPAPAGAPADPVPAMRPARRTTAPEAPSSAAVPAPKPPPDRPRLAAAEIAALLARGDSLLGVGDIASARLFYERASDAGDGRAALRLGATYDPGFLDRVHLPRRYGDVARALSWYHRAHDLGEGDAELWIQGLEAKSGR
jgi:TPR repeat protein